MSDIIIFGFIFVFIFGVWCGTYLRDYYYVQCAKTKIKVCVGRHWYEVKRLE